MFNKNGRRRKKKNWGKPVKNLPHHPRAICHVFRVRGPVWKLVPGHLFYKAAIDLAQRLYKLNNDPKAIYVAKRKQTIIWSPVKKN